MVYGYLGILDYTTNIVANCNGEIVVTKNVGNNDGPGGRNETYKIGSRKRVLRRTATKEVKQGKHPGAHVVKIRGREYVRDNPDSSKKDNVNRNK